MSLLRVPSLLLAALLALAAAPAGAFDLAAGAERRDLQCLDSRRGEPVALQVTSSRLALKRRSATGEPERLEADYRVGADALYIENARIVSETDGAVREVPGEQRVGALRLESPYLILAEPVVPPGYDALELERRLKTQDLGRLVGLRWLMVCREL